MRTAQKFAATGLILALGAAGYGIFALGHPSEVLAKKKAAAAQAAPVDQTPLKDAQELAQMADTPGEQELAKKALRLSDYELDLSFNIALQDAAAHPAELSAEAKEIQARVQKAQKFQQALQAQVNELTAEIVSATGDAIHLRKLSEAETAQLRCRITLGQAIPKGKNMDLIVQKAVEIGAAEIIPILSDRTVVRLDEEHTQSKQAKWQQVAIEAAKQCGQNWLPEVQCPQTLTQFFQSNRRFDLQLIPGAFLYLCP